MHLSVIVWMAAISAASPLPDFEFHDSTRLSAISNRPVTVLVFLAVDCPMANLYATRLNQLATTYVQSGVQFVAIDSMPQDGIASLTRFSRENSLRFPFLKDPDGRIAEICHATRSPQVVVLDRDRRVRYRGRIDDQYEPGKNRGRPTRADLEEALREITTGKPIRVTNTPVFGCAIPKTRAAVPNASVTFHRDIAPILQRHCQICHRPGEIAPFSLLTYDDARRWAAMISEVASAGTMPPWHANPAHGQFKNERRLSDAEKKALVKWSEDGCLEGDTADALPATPWPDSWSIGTPDRILKMPTPIKVPANGIIDYQHVIIETNASTDLWVSAIEIRPGNRRVLHHCNVYLHPPWADDSTQEYETLGTLGSHSFTQFTPGTGPMRFPSGMAKRIPAGWRLHLVLHYAAIGIAAEDQSQIGLKLVDPKEVRKEVATKLILDEELRIPPRVADHRVEQTWRADADCLLLSMFPHMHMRGKSFRYTAEFPDGTSEILLDVPAYDFNWQHRYELATPKRLPAGTTIRCTALYDNSADNPNNPDPSQEVRTGPQSWDEMFNGYFEIVLEDQDLQRIAAADRNKHLPVLIATLAVLSAFVVWRRLTRSSPVDAR